MSIKVWLVDDHAIIREGLKILLDGQRGIQVVGEAATGWQLLEAASESCPELVVMDIAMPDLNGIEATRLLMEKCPRARVVILSVHSTSEHIHRAFKAGARGYVLKESAGRELVAAIRAAACNHRYLSRKITDAAFDILASIDHADSPLERLSQREREILQLVVEGKSSAAIASALGLSPKTVETYRCRLMQKLQINDLPSLVKFAIQHGLTPP